MVVIFEGVPYDPGSLPTMLLRGQDSKLEPALGERSPLPSPKHFFPQKLSRAAPRYPATPWPS